MTGGRIRATLRGCGRTGSMTRHHLRAMLDLLFTAASSDPVRRAVEPILQRALFAFDDTTVIPSGNDDDADDEPRTLRRAEPVVSSAASPR